MSLLDLFARSEDGEAPVGPLLQHITRSFVAAMKLVFDAANAGGRPDMAALRRCSRSRPTRLSGHRRISRRAWGCRNPFTTVLSPESVKLSLTELEAGHQFYIVRANLNLDEALAGKFLTWIKSGAATVISNATVFDGDVTLFDFLAVLPA